MSGLGIPEILVWKLLSEDSHAHGLRESEDGLASIKSVARICVFTEQPYGPTSSLAMVTSDWSLGLDDKIRTIVYLTNQRHLQRQCLKDRTVLDHRIGREWTQNTQVDRSPSFLTGQEHRRKILVRDG